MDATVNNAYRDIYASDLDNPPKSNSQTPAPHKH